MAKFVHTSDWHLGKPFASMEDADKRSRVREARLETLRSVAELVREEGAAFVLVAGDLFDSPSPSRDVVSAAMSAVGAMEVPVLAIPGNHDHAGPGSVWEQDFFERERRELAPNLRVLLEAAPAEVGDAVIHPAPLAHRQLAQDPTAWLRAPEVFEDAGGRVRIVLAHGSVQGFSSDVDEEGLPAAEPNRVELDRLPPGAIDYVALGDWHGTKRVSDAAWYSGTPEPDRFPKSEDHDQGHVLVVDAARAKDPSVRPAATGRLRWHVHEATLGGPSDVDHLREDVAARLGGRTRQDLLRLTLDGGLSLAARSDLDEVLESLGSRLLRLKLDDRVRLAPSREELEGLTERGTDPLVAKVATRLAERIEAGDERGPAAELALRDLYSLAGE
ncbi:MAG: DNA repair exonuclease [Gemmatimonadota bacterium]|nr:DNA repair exonuclease [Gemmatimonadota bacterium]